MRMITRLIFVSILFLIAVPASADLATYIILCDQDEDVTDDQVEAIAAEWFKAAKEVKGGDNLQLYLNFPIAAKSGEVDFAMMLIAPNFAEWGDFMDNYPESPAEDIDDKYEDEVDCGDATLWESVKMK